MPAGMQAAVAGGSLFLISDSSACEGSALCRADTGQAHGCLSKSTEDCFPGEENTGVDAAPTIPGRRGGTSAEAVTAGVWLTGSDPAPGHRPALPPGASRQGFLLRLRLHAGDWAEAVQGNQALGNRPSPGRRLVSAGEDVTAGHNYPCVDDTQISQSTPGPHCSRSV